LCGYTSSSHASLHLFEASTHAYVKNISSNAAYKGRESTELIRREVESLQARVPFERTHERQSSEWLDSAFAQVQVPAFPWRFLSSAVTMGLRMAAMADVRCMCMGFEDKYRVEESGEKRRCCGMLFYFFWRIVCYLMLVLSLRAWQKRAM
jgi:hypothetical protein